MKQLKKKNASADRGQLESGVTPPADGDGCQRQPVRAKGAGATESMRRIGSLRGGFGVRRYTRQR